ncbi:Alpha/Beta hydrolase protein [Protomyces lactucae-debilis]|uniref:Palmitoyl-protein thioesterase 1 n=1 Tax=Protomyces lactucae-debilis TaxID=2754530 RepID=A0A1Y2FDL4_PROLT|nr:Alpha/Beta hydrolase protein [Protomyces lactucae-debilis]ORY82018.1 Alpha/Beta hydrolase protein [Protomyces lactucae-debilis]
MKLFLPTVIWHGLGDYGASEGIQSFVSDISNYTNAFAFAVDMGGRDSSFFGNVNAQVDKLCAQLPNIPELKDGFNAIGFSQGGQFLRAYVQRCNDPPVRNLMTWGSQHSGIQEVPCQEDSAVCKSARALVRSNAFGMFVQSRIIPAQYYKGFDQAAYLEGSLFLADINNEKPEKNATYSSNLASLDNFVMLQFEDDETVIPKASSLFQDVQDGDIVPIERTTYYLDLGLDKLAKKRGLHQHQVPGKHMQIRDKDLFKYMDRYFGKRHDLK